MNNKYNINDILFFVDKFRRNPNDFHELKSLLIILLSNLEYIFKHRHLDLILERLVVGQLIETYKLYNKFDRDEGGQLIEPDYKLLDALKLVIEFHADKSSDSLYKEFINKIDQQK